MPYNFVPDSFHTAVTAEALRAKIGRKPISVTLNDLERRNGRYIALFR